MARPRSEDKRNAILSAATRVFAEQGLAAPTAKIAREAGVAEGTLFTYFANKDELLNQLYLELKYEMREVMSEGLRRVDEEDLRELAHRFWVAYIDWGVMHPHKRKVVSTLTLSDRISTENRVAGAAAFAVFNSRLHNSVEQGLICSPSSSFVGALLGAIAEVTMDFVAREPERAAHYREAGFEAFWKSVSA
ncbi:MULTISPECIES: TetR/AcrR family transcriptional regulator [Lysobacter]|uniref:TetR/AcrR family transcriptional regulator n=1 Tax=Lysobacter gummosus TaxID=262324 RepID=A0ABY3XC29_9GAMM|nr:MULTISPECIES: TetR/AcrR family transcriptional regulator [Lysobacter]ALN92763.1 bacterial regulatory, tetR family protein [Lysobacter gummosus]UJB20419.1 TetR/AcrR family transcriptional regulator [Lysobacter capsici]UJQ30467.1 TetR/AcrR family transcriptional regulator [Lysobacter gummosus]UNP28317.1 TetR/AcrR family transcriptional regulator [Lysobacter gummosus]